MIFSTIHKIIILSISIFVISNIGTGCTDTIDKIPVSLGARIVCRVESNACTGCNLCISACPLDAITEIKLGKQYFCIIDPNKCDGCGECIKVCQDNAIIKVEYNDNN